MNIQKIQNNTCNNCGKQGHSFHQCKNPITSYGIILFRYKNILNEEIKKDEKKQIEYLMLRRKDSFGYIDFIRGKYSLQNIDHIQGIINEMSISEKERILIYSFNELWEQMWGNISNVQYKNEEIISSKKFEAIKNGVLINDKIITLEYIVKNSNTNWTETEWEFPKGRRNFKEKDADCALREFEEETGISHKNITLIDNILPFEEIFIGTNHKSYKHKYFLAYANNENGFNNLYNYQLTEVSKLDWKNIDECLESIRPYNLEKKSLIININKVLQEYRLY